MINVNLSGNFTFGKTDRLCNGLIREGKPSEKFFKEVEKVSGRIGKGNVVEKGETRKKLMEREVKTERKENGELSEDEVHLKIASRKEEETERVLPEDFKKKKEMYGEGLKVLDKYCDDEKMGSREDFLVKYMYGMIYSHMQDYKEAGRCFGKAKEVLDKFEGEEWAKEMLGGEPYYLLKKKILKNQLKFECGHVDKGSSLEDFLSEKCLVHPSLRDRFSVGKLKELFKEMQTCKFNELILECKALSMKEEGSRGSIFFTEKSQKDVNTLGRYPNKNTVYIYPDNCGDSVVKGTIQHEITHEVFNKFNDNGCKPYGCGDIEAVKAHHEAIRSVLWNIVEWILPKSVMKSAMELKGLVKAFACCNISKIVGGQNTMFRMEYVFDKRMPVEHLARNVIYLYYYLCSNELNGTPVYKDMGSEVGKKIFENFRKRGQTDRWIFREVGENLTNVFIVYLPDTRDVEFVTNLYVHLTLEPVFFSSKWFEIFRPYGEYLERYVEPKLRRFIENHPKKSYKEGKRRSYEVEIRFAKMEGFEVVKVYEECWIEEKKMEKEVIEIGDEEEPEDIFVLQTIKKKALNKDNKFGHLKFL